MRTLLASLLAAVSFAAYGDTNPLQFDTNACMLDGTGALALQTLAMPKGWFTTKNTFDPTKTEIRVSESLSATSCALGAGEATFSSKTLGSFKPGYLPVLNPTSKDIGYLWTMIGDLSAAQNQWWYYTGCDGTAVVVGCPEARTVTFTVKAYGQDGQCRTYTDSFGVTSCASDTIELQLAAAHAQDQFIDQALCAPSEPACGIGDCVSDRVRDGGYCDTAFPVNTQLDPKSKPDKPRYFDANEKARGDCKTGSECFCKALLPATCNTNMNGCE